MTEDDKYNLLERVTFGLSLEDAHDTDFVIEAVNENIDLKE